MYFVSRCYFFYKIIESVQQGTQFKNFIFLKVKTSKQFYACLLCMLNSKNLETSTNRNHVKLIYIVSFSIIQIGITRVPCDSWSSNYLRKVKGWRDGYCLANPNCFRERYRERYLTLTWTGPRLELDNYQYLSEICWIYVKPSF